MDPPERPSLFTHPGQCLVTQLARELEQGLLAGGSFCTESEMTDGEITPDANQSPRSTVIHRVWSRTSSTSGVNSSALQVAVVGARGVGKSMLINKVSEQMVLCLLDQPLSSPIERLCSQRADESTTANASGSSYRVVSVVVPAFSFPSSKRVMTVVAAAVEWHLIVVHCAAGGYTRLQ